MYCSQHNSYCIVYTMYTRLLSTLYNTDSVIDCGALPNPTNGQVDTSSGTTSNRLATYSCYTGYAITGESRRVCRADGRWNSTAPTCVGKF